MASIAIFYILAAIAIGGALGLLLHRNLVNNALFLVVTILAIAGLFLLMGAEFLAILQVIVYAGAIMVLFVIVIMLLDFKPSPYAARKRSGKIALMILISVAFCTPFFVIFGMLRGMQPSHYQPSQAEVFDPVQSTAYQVSHVLLTEYYFAFELISVLLLAALIGLIYFARQSQPRDEGRAIR